MVARAARRLHACLDGARDPGHIERVPILDFEKYEGLGNDFVVVEAEVGALSLDAVRAICDRHRGVGADGVLFVARSGGRPAMRVTNADGSRAEMCGNGLRCVALHLARTGAASVGESFVVDTDAGPHACRVLTLDGSVGTVQVSMRPASLAPADVPVVAERPLVDAPFRVDGAEVHVTAVSMGNPHAVVFDAVGPARVSLGPALQEDPRFPAKANVGFARLLPEDAARARAMELFVYERGAGWTEACGTGACAAVVAAVETGRVPRGEPVEVRLPGGPLSIVAGALGERILMTGPARHVFSGHLR
jgi:diaminopimelate epimerase